MKKITMREIETQKTAAAFYICGCSNFPPDGDCDDQLPWGGLGGF